MSPDHSNFEALVDQYRRNTFRYLPHLRVKSESEAIGFVNERKFIFFWPIKGIPFPSLWGATAGDRPVPNNHDDPAHVTWRWKDDLLGTRKWYYAKILHRKSTIISLETIKYFFALSDGAFQGEGDFEYLYRIGQRSRIELEVFSQLIQHGPLDTVALRKRLTSILPFSHSEFNRTLERLQGNFHILPIGLTENGRWHYSYLYDTVERLYPEKISAAYEIKKNTAREMILIAYFETNGTGTFKEIKKLLQWKSADIEQAIVSLQDAGSIFPVERPDNQPSVFAIRACIP